MSEKNERQKKYRKSGKETAKLHQKRDRAKGRGREQKIN
jgi:hypothetical protein